MGGKGCPSPCSAPGRLTSVRKRTDCLKLGLVWKSLMGSVCRDSSQHSTRSWGECTCFMFRRPQTRICRNRKGAGQAAAGASNVLARGGAVLGVMVHQVASRARK